MTFKQFEATVKHFRNDIVVSKHGDYCHNKSQNTLGIMYLKKDGELSKVYDFSGTYSEILNKLDITKFYENNDVDFINNEITRLEKGNGRINLFSKLPVDNSAEIEELKAQLETMKSWYKII